MSMFREYVMDLSVLLFTFGAAVLVWKVRSFASTAVLVGTVLAWLGYGIALYGPSSAQYRGKFEDGTTAVVMKDPLVGTHLLQLGVLAIGFGFLFYAVSLRK